MMRKGSINWAIIIILIVGLIYSYWDSIHDAYGKDFNKQRHAIGILKIPHKWVTETEGTKTKLWKPPNNIKIEKGRFGKEVLVNKSTGEIYLERDRIVTKSSGKDEAIEVSYKFTDEPKFVYKYFEFVEGSMKSERELSKAAFEKIAKEWNVELK